MPCYPPIALTIQNRQHDATTLMLTQNILFGYPLQPNKVHPWSQIHTGNDQWALYSCPDPNDEPEEDTKKEHDDYTEEAYDLYLGAELLIPSGDTFILGRVIK